MPENKAIINGYSVWIGNNEQSCSCLDFEYRRKEKGEDCKHLTELRRRLAAEGDGEDGR